MNVYQTQLEEKICRIIEPTLLDLGYEPVRIRLMGSARNKTLQIMIDRLNGEPVTVEDCESASRQISVLLDVEDVISTYYNLELSSAGLSRPLTRVKDYKNHVGESIKLTTKLAIDGQRNFSGVLSSVTDDAIVLMPQLSDITVEIAFVNISDANLQPDLKLKQEKKILNRRRK